MISHLEIAFVSKGNGRLQMDQLRTVAGLSSVLECIS